MKRKHWILIGVMITCFVAVLLLLPTLIDVNRYRPQIEAKIEGWLRRQVSLGQMRLSLLPFGFQVEDIVIWEDPAFQTGRPFADAKTLYVQPKLLPLIVGNIEIDSLRLSSPNLELVRNHEGTWNS